MGDRRKRIQMLVLEVKESGKEIVEGDKVVGEEKEEETKEKPKEEEIVDEEIVGYERRDRRETKCTIETCRQEDEQLEFERGELETPLGYETQGAVNAERRNQIRPPIE